MTKFYFLFIISILAILSCNKAKKDSSISTSISVSVGQPGQSAIFNGQINDLLLSAIKQTGFVWSKVSDPVNGGANVLLYTTTSPALQFTFDVSSGLTKDSTYFVKSFYVDNSNIYHYSQQTSFVSKGTKQPNLNLLPAAYTWGQLVPLTLDSLIHTDINNINVIINQTTIVHPTQISGNQIFFNVPYPLNQQDNTLAVSILGQQSNAIDLELQFPIISPGGNFNLLPGGTITINGQYFNPTVAHNVAVIDTTALTVVSATPTQLVVSASNVKMSDRGALVITTGTHLSFTSAIMINAPSETSFTVYKFLQPKNNVPGAARTGAVVVALNGYIYAGLGRSATTGQGLSDWWKYDPVADAWTSEANCPQSAISVNVFSINNKAYVGMGSFDGSPSNVFYCYNPASNTWSTVAPFPGNFTSLNVSFNSAIYGYIVGGYQISNAGGVQVSDVWKFDPAANQWTKINPFPGAPRIAATGFTVNNHGYVVGGQAWALNPASTDTWAFDFSTETWIQVAGLPSGAATSSQFSFSINNIAYICGTINQNHGFLTSCIYAYNPVTNAWALKENMFDSEAYSAGAASVGGTGYIIGGSNYSNGVGSQSFFIFNP